MFVSLVSCNMNSNKSEETNNVTVNASDAIYNINQDDVWWSASDIGWIVGHSYIVYAPLFYGCTTVLFEGKPVGTPDGVQWMRAPEWFVDPLSAFTLAYDRIYRH